MVVLTARAQDYHVAKQLEETHTLSPILGPHLRMPNTGFNPGFTSCICYIKRKGVNPGLNPGFGVLRFWLR
jgi:hypothetical protein